MPYSYMYMYVHDGVQPNTLEVNYHVLEPATHTHTHTHTRVKRTPKLSRIVNTIFGRSQASWPVT